MIGALDIGWRRWLTHSVLAALTAVGCYLAHLYAPRAYLPYTLTIGCGYLSLVFIVISLAIGPLKLLAQRGRLQPRNPVNINLRRDVGIWAAITGVVHVIFGLQLRANGEILLYFFEPAPNGGYGPLLTSRFGISNHIGLIATVVLIVLLVLSNDVSLRKLKGKRWKWVQRWNYGLAALAFIHTFLYQDISQRERPFVLATLLLAMVTLAVQAVGFEFYRSRLRLASRRRERQPGISISG